MTEGISKERLIEIKQSLPYGQARLNLDRLIKAECKELDPWLPLDSVPGDIDLLFKDMISGKVFVGQRSNYSNSYIDENGNHINRPTHYKILK